jgi:GcrA cell cycle regulator
MTDQPEKYDVENAPDRSRIAPLPASNLYALTAPSPDVEQPARTLPNGKFVTTLTLNSRTCRWPIGDPKEPDFHYCGQRPESGGKYCDSHERKGHQAPSRNRRR